MPPRRAALAELKLETMSTMEASLALKAPMKLTYKVDYTNRKLIVGACLGGFLDLPESPFDLVSGTTAEAVVVCEDVMEMDKSDEEEASAEEDESADESEDNREDGEEEDEEEDLESAIGTDEDESDDGEDGEDEEDESEPSGGKRPR